MDDLKDVISKNLVQLRTQAKLTQLQLAEMLNYSDKAVSKWERGEAIPDIRVLMRLAEIYNITVDDIVKSDDARGRVRPKMNVGKKRLLISLLSIGLVWFIATGIFMVLFFINDLHNEWLIYIIAPFLSAVIGLVFSVKWGNALSNAVCCSLIIFTAAVIIHVYVWVFTRFTKIYFIYIVAGVFEVLIVLWFTLRYLNKRRK